MPGAEPHYHAGRMLVLALDTTTRRGSVALIDDSGRSHVASIPDGEPVATRLPGEIGRIVTGAGTRLQSVDVFAVAVGPGSFTGLRIGIAAMQGLAFALSRPLIGVSGLDALALSARGAGARNVATWVDAWRGEVYGARYRDGLPEGDPTVDQPEQQLSHLAAEEDWTFIGDGAETYRAVIAAASPTFAVEARPAPLLAEAVARLALTRLAAGETGAPGAIRPLYVRRPDAELARSAKRGLEGTGA